MMGSESSARNPGNKRSVVRGTSPWRDTHAMAVRVGADRGAVGTQPRRLAG